MRVAPELCRKSFVHGPGLYTRTDGTPSAAQRYDEGISGDAAFLFDEGHSAAGNFERLNRMLAGIILWQIEKTTTRVKSGFDLNTGEDVVDVIITGKRVRPDLSKEDPLPPHVKSWKEYNPTLPPFSGGWGNRKYDRNANIRVDNPKMIELLGSEIYQRTMNCEIEAKLGWYMYRLRIGKAEGLENQLGKNYSKSFKRMAAAIRASAINTESGANISTADFTWHFLI